MFKRTYLIVEKYFSPLDEANKSLLNESGASQQVNIFLFYILLCYTLLFII